MEENAVLSEKKPKVWLAILAAIGMGLIGCILWGLLYYWGYIAWAAALVVVLASGWAYKKLNLKMDTKGYIIVAVISAVEVVLTMLLSLNIGVMVELNGEYSFFECFQLIFSVLQSDKAIMDSLIIDVVLSLILIVVGVLVLFFSEKSAKKKSKKIKKDSVADFEINDNKQPNETQISDEAKKDE